MAEPVGRMIPVATTTITVRRSDQDGTKDLRSTLAWSDVATGVRAVIGSPVGDEATEGGTRTVVRYSFQCDPISVRHDDRIVDDGTGVEYDVLWATARVGFGLDHETGELRLVTDRVPS